MTDERMFDGFGLHAVVVGSGAREHAITLQLLDENWTVDVVPGNPMIPGSTLGSLDDVYSLDAHLFIIGPEVPLAAGMADKLRAADKTVFGPGAEMAQLEGSKIWMKRLLAEAGVPTALWRSVDSHEAVRLALGWLKNMVGCTTYVIKTDGLAAGKGVTVTSDYRAAEADGYAKVDQYPDRVNAVRRALIEEGFEGVELSQFGICNGREAYMIDGAKDYKRLNDGDKGPNTGGMGAVSPLEATPHGISREQQVSIFAATTGKLMTFMVEHDMIYIGALFAGLMLTETGAKVLEYNIRFGDPEMCSMMARCTGGFGLALLAAARGDRSEPPTFSNDVAVTVILAQPGYAELETLTKGEVISGIEAAAAVDGVRLYFAGVSTDEMGNVVTNGGRVIAVTATAPSLEDARARAYQAAGQITWGANGPHYRTDIGA